MAAGNYCVACHTGVAPGAGDEEPCPTCGLPTRLRERWRVLGEIARGGSARVFRGHDTREGRDVALKVLDLADVEDWKQVELFERQLPLLRRLRHPGIPEVFDTFEIAAGRRTLLVLVLSLHRGPNLRDALADGLRFDERSIRELLGRMLDILDYLHGFSPPILHRDLKPANILLELPADGALTADRLARAQPVLIDFDTARGVAIDPAAADGTMVGSAGYVPIEQLAGRPVPASDLYALGMTAIAALSQRDLLELPVERSRLKFQRFVNVSPELRGVLERMIEPVVEDRFPDVAAVRRALAAAPSERTPAAPTTRRPVVRNLGIAAAVALLGAGVIVVLSAPGGRPAPAPASSTPSAPPTTSPATSPAPTDGSELCTQVLHASCAAVLRPTKGVTNFARSLSLSGDTLAAGDPHTSDGGTVHIYRRGAAGWTEARALVPLEPDRAGQFGWALALEGDTLAIGGRLAGGHVEGALVSRAGIVDVYVRGGATWTRQTRLVGPGAESWFGHALALSGDVLAVGEKYLVGGNLMASAITIFVRDGEAWSRAAQLRDFRGLASFALDGDTLAVGAPLGTIDERVPAVHVFVRDGAGWTLQTRLAPPMPTGGFGVRVALDGDTLAVATPSFHAGVSLQRPEEVHIFNRTGTAWTAGAVLRAPDAAAVRGFGRDLALSGDRLVVLAEDDPGAERRDTSVHLFTRTGATWRPDRTFVASIDASTITGAVVALDGETLALGAPARSSPDSGRWQGTVFILSP